MVAVLFTAGVQLPAIPLDEVAGKVNAVPAQYGPIGLKVGVNAVPTVTVHFTKS